MLALSRLCAPVLCGRGETKPVQRWVRFFLNIHNAVEDGDP